jgi:hypothetical protein
MLLRVLLGLFFIVHGLVHVAIWAPKYDPAKVSFDASHSWLLGDRRPLARVLAFAAAAILVVAGIALLTQGGWWRPTAVVGLCVSTALLLVYFTPLVLVHPRRQPRPDRRHRVACLASEVHRGRVIARTTRWAVRATTSGQDPGSGRHKGWKRGTEQLATARHPLPPGPQWRREAPWTRR